MTKRQGELMNEHVLETCPPLEQAVVRFIQELSPATLSDEVRTEACRLMRDQVAVQIGSARLPWSEKILAFATSRKVPGNSSVAAGEITMSAPDAAFVNAAYGHGFEYDDAHRHSASHPGSCVISAALAIGEELNATMDDVITAIVAGYEVYTRIGNLAAPDLLKRGFHPHAILSNFGAAAVAAKLRGLDTETTLNALAIALSHASGTTEYTSTGGSIKRVHAGIGTRNGMLAADLARAGVTGPRAFLSGAKGFFKTFLQREAGNEPERAFAADRDFEITKLWLKPYCCCGCIHAYIDAARPFTDRLADIQGITVKIQSSANVVVGSANTNAFAPRNIEHVQFSLPVQVAFTLLGLGNGYQVHRDYLEGKVDMDAVMATANLIEIQETPELDTAYPGKFVADIVVHFRDGTSRQVFVEDSIGTMQNPMPEDVQDDKFLEVTTPVLGEARARELHNALKNIDPATPVSRLTELFTL